MTCPIPSVPSDVDTVIYHARCMDGFTAAWAAWRVLGNRAEYIAASYGDAPPDVTGKNVAVVDFSYPLDVLDAMCGVASSLVVLDHHKTAEEALRDHPNAYFDGNHSGAYLACRWFNPACNIPRLVLYVEDRDLWRWKMEDSEAINHGLRLLPQSFEAWDANIDAPSTLSVQGRAVMRLIEMECESAEKASRVMILNGQPLWVYNTRCHISDVGSHLAKRAPFAALLWYPLRCCGTATSSLGWISVRFGLTVTMVPMCLFWRRRSVVVVIATPQGSGVRICYLGVCETDGGE